MFCGIGCLACLYSRQHDEKNNFQLSSRSVKVFFSVCKSSVILNSCTNHTGLHMHVAKLSYHQLMIAVPHHVHDVQLKILVKQLKQKMYAAHRNGRVKKHNQASDSQS